MVKLMGHVMVVVEKMMLTPLAISFKMDFVILQGYKQQQPPMVVWVQKTMLSPIAASFKMDSVIPQGYIYSEHKSSQKFQLYCTGVKLDA